MHTHTTRRVERETEWRERGDTGEAYSVFNVDCSKQKQKHAQQQTSRQSKGGKSQARGKGSRDHDDDEWPDSF